MKRKALLVFLAALSLSAQSNVAPSQPNATQNPTTRYYVVFLRPDPSRRTVSKDDGDRIQNAHMANIRKMAGDGVLIAAGPFDDSPATISGIFVLKAASLQSAQDLARQDPTVVEHRNTVDVYAWQGPPELGAEYIRLHKLNPKTPENMQAHPLCLLYRGTTAEGRVGTHNSLLDLHERYIDDLRRQGKLGAAGRIETSDHLLSLVIFRAIPLEEAHRLLQADPAVRSGMLRMECHTWWSSDHVLPW
jgi:uncharacterized protein YciI